MQEQDNNIDIKQAEIVVQDVRNLFIKECEQGLWSKNTYNVYNNRYFTLNAERKSRSWCIKFSTEFLTLQDLRINYLYFRFFLLPKIEKTIKNFERCQKSIKIAGVAEKFFKENKEIHRSNKLNQLLNN
jgi:hypothetical protein